jgi:hypothetical protein
LFWLALFSFFPVQTAAFRLDAFLKSDVPLFVGVIVWTIGLIIADYYKGNWIWGRCHRSFFRTGVFGRRFDFTRCCIHCGLPKWSGK